MSKSNLSIQDRFMSHVQKLDDSNGCWEWIGSKFRTGYGAFEINYKMYRAHRVSYALFVETIPDTLHVLHRCDNRACVNPAHLFLGTQQDNMQDMMNKNRQHHPKDKGENSHNHKLTEQEVYKIRKMIEQGYAQRKIAYLFGVSQLTISCIKTRRNWGWLK